MSDVNEAHPVRPKRGRPTRAELDLRAKLEAQRAAPEVERPDPRDDQPREPDPRADGPATDSRDEAARYMAEYDEHNTGFEAGVDRYKLDLSIIPEGWDYNWKTVTIYNQPNPAYAAELRRSGWRPVLTKRHPELMPPGHPGDDPILLDGQGLYERPLEMSLRSRAREANAAREAILRKEIQAGNAPPGQLDRTKPTIKKEYGHVAMVPAGRPQV